MAYTYPEQQDEAAAAALLRERGWKVEPPSCPECSGFGVLSKITVTHPSSPVSLTETRWLPGLFGETTRPCSLGCERPNSFFY